MRDGTTSDLLDFIEQLRDTPSGDLSVEVTDTAVIDALTLFIERVGYPSSALAFLSEYFHGEIKRTP